jgi:hypothetical protein
MSDAHISDDTAAAGSKEVNAATMSAMVTSG